MSRVQKITATLAVVTAIAVLLPPFINANRFRKRLANSASGAIGRSVTLGDVKVRLLPNPGFDIKTFVVGDDPAFSAEPLLRAEQVTATLRISSLWRGKFEIARLDFKSPSLNLVRNATGDWNIESLLRYTSSLRTAPTSRRKPEANPRFPYIEAESGRINFKLLQEKTVYALTQTDFALWLESENQWNMRLEGRPMRTDANLNDTGTLRIDGFMQRGETLGKSHLQLRATLENTQLGQFSALLSGKDRGFRGNLDIDATAQGTAEKLEITADAKINDFRRYDIANVEPLLLRTHCTGALTRSTDLSTQQTYESGVTFTGIDCESGVGDGHIMLTGTVALARNPDYDLQLAASNLPVSSPAAWLRKTKREVPDDLIATGVISGNFFFRKSGMQEANKTDSTSANIAVWGGGRASNLRLTSKSRESDLNAGTVSFGFDSVPSPADQQVLVPRLKNVSGNHTKTLPRKTKTNGSGNATLRIDPFPLRLGETNPIICGGSAGATGFSIQAKGEGDLLKLTAAARTIGLGNRLPFAQGSASFDISVDGMWAGFLAPAVTGTAQLHRVSVPVDDSSAILHIASANLSLTPQGVGVEKLLATVSGTRTAITGTVSITRTCETVSCPAQFDLQASEMNFDDLNRVLNPKFRRTSWLSLGKNILGANTGSIPKLLQFDAVGRLSANRVLMKSLAANKVSAQVEIKHGAVNIRNIHGEVLGGRYAGDWSANFTGTQPEYAGSGTIDGMVLTQLNSVIHATVGSGILTRTGFTLKFSGGDAATLRKTATGQLTFNWNNGSLLAATRAGRSSALQFSSWQATAKIAGETISLTSGSMQTAAGHYATSGIVSFGRNLDLQLGNASEVLSIKGPLEAPIISSRNISVRLESASNQKDAKPAKTP